LQNGEWRSYSGDAGSRKYAPLDQINKDSVKALKIAWPRPAVDAGQRSAAALREQLPRDAADAERGAIQPSGVGPKCVNVLPGSSSRHE